MRDTLGELILIARASDPLEVSPGVFKTVYTIDTPTGEYLGGIGSGDATVFNDRGEVVFLADFTDGSEDSTESVMKKIPCSWKCPTMTRLSSR